METSIRDRWRDRSAGAAWAPYVVLLVVSIAVVGWHMHKYPAISPIDEGVHFDYIVKLPHVPAGGEKMGQLAMRETACRTYGDSVPGTVLPPCDTSRFDPVTFPSQGFSTAGTTPPFYYAVTAVVARPIAAVTGISLWDVTRATGALWLFTLLALSYRFARRLGAPPVGGLGAALMVGASSDVASSAAAIGPDVAVAVTGALVLLAAWTYDGSRRRLGWLLGAVVLASLAKLTGFTAVGAAMVFLVLRAAWARWGRRPETIEEGVEEDVALEADTGAVTVPGALAVAGLMLAFFGAVAYAWQKFYEARVIVDVDTIPMNAATLTERIPWQDLIPGVFYTFLPPMAGNWNASFLESVNNARLEWIVGAVLTFGVLAGALAGRRTVSALGLGTLLLAILGPTLLVLLNFYANGLYFGIPPRYGFALLPAFIALTAVMLRSVGAARALLVLGALSVVSLFF